MNARVIVIGAGPMGLAAALESSRRGFDVTVLEKESVGAALRRWGPTRFFSPLGMNVPPSFRDVLGSEMPPDDALLTGPEMIDRVLLPLSSRAPLAGRILTGYQVTAIGRKGLTRLEFPNHPIRRERPFVIVARTSHGEERFEAEVVLDASGGYSIPAFIGYGGLPAAGEDDAQPVLIRHLGALHDRLDSLAAKSILLVGHGHSAANAIVALAGMASQAPGTRITWAVRTMNRRPCAEVADDPLMERKSVVEQANALAEAPPEFLTIERRASIESLARNNGHVDVGLTASRNGSFDAVAAFTGYRPDLSFLSELPLEISPVSEGSARLYRAVSAITDCLSVPSVSADDLSSGEDGFYFIGSKSYGRAPTFLLSTGLHQLNTILERMAQR
jgi:thioredoxin reductase